MVRKGFAILFMRDCAAQRRKVKGAKDGVKPCNAPIEKEKKRKEKYKSLEVVSVVVVDDVL
jgi:hypothetical protein